MTEATPSPKRGCSGTSVGMALLLAFILLFLPAFGNTSLGEVLFHLLAGWTFHAWRNLPRLADPWSGLIVPLGCLFIASFMFHRFAVWWLHEKAPGVKWGLRQSWATLGVLLGISAAAIAMSGITHQSAWLATESWIETRGMARERGQAVTKLKQLMLGILSFHEDHGRYPESLQQIAENTETLKQLLHTEPKLGTLAEPYYLLQPGRIAPAHGDEPLLLSPFLPKTREYAVGFGDHSVRLVKERELQELLSNVNK